MPELHALARHWHRSPIEPVFPALTCPVQATLTTGVPPRVHGVIANGLFDRATRRPEFWVFPDERVQARRVWEDFRQAGLKTGVFFLLNIRNCKTDAALLPRPIHREDGSITPWCWHKPEGLYPELVRLMDDFDLLRFWGPLAGIESSLWIAEAAARTIHRHGLDVSFVYLPHTDYAPQKFGPASESYRQAHRELDAVLVNLIESVAEDAPHLWTLIVSEYAMTEVNRVVEPNKLLRRAGLLAVERRGPEEHLDFEGSAAFALVDHQIAHVYCDRQHVGLVRSIFEAEPAVESVVARPSDCGLDHPNSGEVILVARRDAWFAYPWWHEASAAPAYARTIDIHRKPGYDPLEMFWDPKIGGTAQDPLLIRGSHGAFPRDRDQNASVLSNLPGVEAVFTTGDVAAALRGALEESLPRL